MSPENVQCWSNIHCDPWAAALENESGLPSTTEAWEVVFPPVVLRLLTPPGEGVALVILAIL